MALLISVYVAFESRVRQVVVRFGMLVPASDQSTARLGSMIPDQSWAGTLVGIIVKSARTQNRSVCWQFIRPLPEEHSIDDCSCRWRPQSVRALFWIAGCISP